MRTSLKYFIEFLNDNGEPMLGSSAYIRLDGRLSLASMMQIAYSEMARKNAKSCRIIRTASLLNDRPHVLVTLHNPLED